MHALIMAGGEGSRLNLGEKPLILLNGQPMIAYVIHAYREAGCEPVAAVSPRTPMTQNWCRVNGVPVCRLDGDGYIKDMVRAVRHLEVNDPLIVSVADIPCIHADLIRTIISAYHSSKKDALSTWIPASLVRACRESMPYRETIQGIEACPAGINIVRGDIIDESQDEHTLLLQDPCLAINVNTRADRAFAEAYLARIP